MLDLRRLHYFVTVAEELHFSRAATRLGMAQPPLSQQIQKLETELGAQLFVRSSRSVSLTEAGHALLPEARRLLALSDNIGRIPRAVQEGHAGQLRLGLTGSTAFRLVPILLREFRGAYPNVGITLLEMPTAEQLEFLASGDLDLGLVRMPTLRADIQTEIIWSEPLLVALPTGHWLAHSETIAIADLSDENFVMFPRQHGPGLYGLVVGICEDAGFAPRIVQEAIQMQTLVGLVAAGFGLTFVPASVQDFRLHGVVYRRIAEPAPKSAVGVAWNPGLTSAVRDRFIAVATSQASRTDN